jgi:hypothetical protein
MGFWWRIASQDVSGKIYPLRAGFSDLESNRASARG